MSRTGLIGAIHMTSSDRQIREIEKSRGFFIQYKRSKFLQ
jgi:hypothetical protein